MGYDARVEIGCRYGDEEGRDDMRRKVAARTAMKGEVKRRSKGRKMGVKRLQRKLIDASGIL